MSRRGEWNCPTCYKTFGRKGDLTRHQLLHTGIKPYVCEFCSKGFAQFSGLKTHWNVHTRQKPHACGIGACTKVFGDPSSCARHRAEFHRRKGTYKCIVPGCRSKIKRRSAFVAHLRKHGLDPTLLDLDAMALQSGASDKGALASAPHFASPDVENDSQQDAASQSSSSSLPRESARYYPMDDSSIASHGGIMENNGWPDDGPFDCGQVTWPSANYGLLLAPMPAETEHVQRDHPGFSDIYPPISSDFEDPFCSDGIRSTTVDYPLFDASLLNLPVVDPFLEAGSDGSQSPWSSLSCLANDASQESLLYNMM